MCRWLVHASYTMSPISPILMVLRQLPMSSTNKILWVIGNITTSPNWPKMPLDQLDWIEHKLQRWNSKTQLVVKTFRKPNHGLQISKSGAKIWSFSKFMAPRQIWGNLRSVKNGMELTEASRRSIPRQAYTGRLLIFLLPMFALTWT